ncbi:ribosome biogenesis protein SLX9-domain-containing protein [Lineolata rhizophorae]|uniref:Ribosome biogenesis protein SLX9 n=1 Tax=Lineolata rhizophorae TaxID=578093 RepID=A0A6A6NPY2_9PEZI|nr:ribosome biogenesis protein SLX9-domain-containing protein [Lineolata rhizophorae]
MAPIPPRKSNPKSSSRTAESSRPRTTYPAPTTTFTTTKKDKRAMKRSILLNKIEKSYAQPAKKRRRPSKKLVANLESLTEALPDVGEDDRDNGDGEAVVGQARIRHRSLKSRPGAMKRKEKLERMERERFDRNMAQMLGGGAQQPPGGMETDAGAGAAEGSRSALRFSALRSFIEGTMEKKEFKKS